MNYQGLKLNVKVSQKQILTPGLVQMVSVLALNKLELKDMINAEINENPVLEELETAVPLIDEVSGREEKRDRIQAESDVRPEGESKEERDPFDEIDFGSFFQDYLDPGYRSPASEVVERPSFENFISRPTTLSDHLTWQLGAIHLSPEVREAAELVIGNLDDDGYLTASEEELLGVTVAPPEFGRSHSEQPAREPLAHRDHEDVGREAPRGENPGDSGSAGLPTSSLGVDQEQAAVSEGSLSGAEHAEKGITGTAQISAPAPAAAHPPAGVPAFGLEVLQEAIRVVKAMDPIGVASRDLRECLLVQLDYQQQSLSRPHGKNGAAESSPQLITDARNIVDKHLHALQNKQYREIGRAIGRSVDDVMLAVDLIRTLDPKPGARYNQTDPRLIEPDVAFVKNGDEWVVMMNEDDIPVLRLNPTYKKLLSREAAEKDVRNYVKERYKSAIQLIKNIEQRKNTILKVCYAIIGRQTEFLERGVDQLKPMMIKDVAEEVGVHPSTVSRAVASKYVHTPQGVYELRYFFSESVNGPEGDGTSLLILKRRVKKLIEEEDPARPYTDEQITRILQSQGIQVTRRTVAKYREDMRIPSTHQRRVKN